MSNPTRPASMTPEEAQKLIERMAHHGARLSVADPRVTSWRDWLLTTVGMMIVAVGGWLVSSVTDLNRRLDVVISQGIYSDKTNTAQDNRLDSYDLRLRYLEKAVK